MRKVLGILLLIEYSNASNFFGFDTCFKKVALNDPKYTVFYCCGNILIWVCSIINTVLFSCLLYWHLKEKGANKAKTYTRLKTWMLFFLTLFSFMAAIRYTFSLSATTPWLYAIVLVLQQQFQAVSYLLICWYFVKNAEKLLETKAFGKFITIVACAGAIAFFIIMWF